MLNIVVSSIFQPEELSV